MELKTVLIVLHLLGVAIGAGSAYASDFTFIRSIRDGAIDQKECTRLRRFSRFVWGGLAVLTISGIGLFLTDPSHYLSSSKFLAKMTIVAVLVANGVIFHQFHLPRLIDGTWTRHQRFLIVSGILSFCSWGSAIFLGFLRQTPLTYVHLLTLYVGIVAVGICVGLLVRRIVFPKQI